MANIKSAKKGFLLQKQTDKEMQLLKLLSKQL